MFPESSSPLVLDFYNESISPLLVLSTPTPGINNLEIFDKFLNFVTFSLLTPSGIIKKFIFLLDKQLLSMTEHVERGTPKFSDPPSSPSTSFCSTTNIL